MGIFNGGVTEFQIRNLNVKEGGYESGDSITGEVVLVATREIKCREFVVTLRGSANTQWTREHGGGEASYTEYFYGYEPITQDCKVFHSAGIISPGQYVHKFAFRLPTSCHPSFYGVHGSVSYVLKAKIDRRLAIDNKVTTSVLVRGSLDLNALSPSVRSPMENQGVEELGKCCCKKGRLRIHGRIPKGGYALGENVDLKIEVENLTSKPIVMLIVNVVESALSQASAPVRGFWKHAMNECTGHGL